LNGILFPFFVGDVDDLTATQTEPRDDTTGYPELTPGTLLFPEQKTSFVSALLKPEEASCTSTVPSEAGNRDLFSEDIAALQEGSSVELRPVVKLKKKVSFKESVSVRSAENGVLATAEELKFSPEDSGRRRPVVEDKGKEDEVMTVVNFVGGLEEDRGKEEEVMPAVNFASLGHKGSPSYVREDVGIKNNFSF
jgi:hypothetical protein